MQAAEDAADQRAERDHAGGAEIDEGGRRWELLGFVTSGGSAATSSMPVASPCRIRPTVKVSTSVATRATSEPATNPASQTR